MPNPNTFDEATAATEEMFANDEQLSLADVPPVNEENQSGKDRIIADAYGCVKKLLGTELEQVDLDYSVTKNETTGCSDVSFSSKDENVKINEEVALKWLQNGAIPSDTVRSLLKNAGVMAKFASIKDKKENK